MQLVKSVQEMKSFELIHKKQSSQGHSNAVTLSREFNWVSKFINSQMNSYFQATDHISEINAIDLTNDESTYAEFIKYYNFNIDERIILLIAMAPHVCPQLLDCFF